jgi:hypothetical protein
MPEGCCWPQRQLGAGSGRLSQGPGVSASPSQCGFALSPVGVPVGVLVGEPELGRERLEMIVSQAAMTSLRGAGGSLQTGSFERPEDFFQPDRGLGRELSTLVCLVR